jgi:drug/metabolite transporter (DMT)-like permease
MESLVYAVLSVLSTALLRLTLKHCAVRSTNAWGTLTVYHIGATLVLIPFLGIPSISTLTQTQILLLLATGALFSVASFLDIVAMKHIDASAGEIFHTLTFIVSVGAGLVMFHEACTLSKILGTLIIAAGIIYEARAAFAKASHGFWLKCGSAALIATAMVITKHLTSNTPSEIIILSGFILPGIVYSIFGWRSLSEIPAAVRDSGGVLLAVPILDALSYTFGIRALAGGEMSTTYIIFQTTISAVFLLEVVLHGWKRDVYLHRAISAGLCMCGALVAIVS